MKHYIYKLSFLLAITLFVGCQTDGTTEVGGSSSLTISLEQVSRLSLGDKRDDIYPVYWNEGDIIGADGEPSDKAQIDANNPSVATFSFGKTIKYPYGITYPYCEATSAESPKVVFLAEQNYVEGSFDAGAVPMCGYVKQGGGVALRHLAAILRFSLKCTEENTVLDRIVITSSTAKLAGEFEVDCQNGTISPSANTTNVVTYNINQPLSTTNAKVFYVSLPAVNVGECKVELFDGTGGKMTAVWSDKMLSAGVVREFKTVSYGLNSSCVLNGFDSEDDDFVDYGVSGYVKDTNGNPIEGVAVSDGFTVVTTDSDGFYKMAASSDAWHIYISVPSEYEVPINEYGQPCFYKKYEREIRRYNFTLTPLAGGKESKFALFTFADPQVTNSTCLNRFKTSMSSVKSYVTEVSSTGLSCYGITLGDILSNSSINNDEAYRDDMRDGFAASKVGMPVFQVMGNHDCVYYNESSPIAADETSSTYNLKAQRAHEDMFGPVNYSFNRGDVHIVAMRDIVYKSTTTTSCDVGFSPAQVAWLIQDLALVPKDKLVLLCVHIQLLNRTPNYTQDVLNALNQYNEVHVLSGHTHVQHNYIHKYEGSPYTNIYEHNTCALCGPWWHAKVAGDGSPSGYNVFVANGNKLEDWYYMGYNDAAGENKRSHQMRLYRGNAAYGADAPTDADSNPYGIKGYYAFNYGDDYILANVYNADNDWVIKVYEDGVYTGNMTNLPHNKPAISSLIGNYTKDDPRRAKDGVEATVEFFVAGLRLGLLGSWSAPTDSAPNGEPGSAAYGSTHHMYKYKLKNKSATVKVVAIDRFGNEYTETKFADNGTLESYRWK